MTHDEIYNTIVEELHSGQITGWCPVPKALELASAVLALRPKVILETGTWAGRSLLPMAIASHAIDAGRVICIDPWSAEASVEEYDKPNVDWWKKVDHEKIYQQFLGHLRRLGLEQRVEVLRMKSDDAPVPEQVDFLHLDSNHTALASREVMKFATRVRVGGICVLDDLEWKTGGVECVAQAVELLLELGFVELHRTKLKNGCWGFFQYVRERA